MAKIRILPEQLANQIAAGEVVERPASVVKELVENSLDAGATRIDVEIEGGGTTLIRILDNGEGMDEDDVLLSLERHGTSKIATDQDLTTISTLGFRGEAIPSIGSVAKMTITSRRADAELGTRAEIQYGKLVRVHEAGCSRGTIFEVRSLFGNTPARKKFLRTARTELGHIDEVVKNYALARPDVSFSLTINGKESIVLDNTLSLVERLATVINYRGEFITIGEEHQASPPDRFVFGYLIPPDRLGSGPARLRLFVNGRAVRDRMMSHAVAEGLRNFLMKGKNPAGLIHLILPPDEVDVNVHPAKHEVRFRNSRDVHYLVSSAVSGAMAREQVRLQATLFGRNDSRPVTVIPMEREEPAPSPFQPVEPLPSRHREPAPSANSGQGVAPARHIAETAPSVNPAKGPPQDSAPPSPYQQEPVENVHREGGVNRPAAPPPSTLASAEPSSCPLQPRPQPAISPEQPHQATLLPKTPAGHGLEIVGQFGNLYIFCRNNAGQLVVIDQHAAHERLLFEELRQQFSGNTVPRQNLLFPETVDLTLLQARLVEDHLEELEQMGFSLREFGGSSYLVAAVPALAGTISPSTLLTEILEQFGSDKTRRDQDDRIDHILSTMACKAAVKAGTALSPREIDALLTKMAKADLFSHCPHGRPVVKIFSQRELQKWFHRS